MTNWKETTLGAEVEVIGGGTPRTSVNEYWNGDIPWLSVVDFNNENRWVYDAEKHITKQGLENSATKLLDEGDLIISARGTVGAFAQLKFPMAFNQSCYGLRAKEGTTNNFLYYLLKFSIPQVQKNVHGAVFDTITRDTFDQIRILLPPIGEQKEIAGVLSSLDDKIELFREENKTLEATAQTIFKEWFVNFNFSNTEGKPYKSSGGKMIDSELDEIPEGWRAGRLSDIAVFLNGLALQKYPPESSTEYLPVIKIKELNSGISEQTDKASARLDSKYVVENGDVLFSWSGSLIVDIWKHGKGALNQHLFRVTSATFPKWFYFYWIKVHLPNFQQTATAKAVTMGHIQRHHLDDALVVIPDEEFMKVADNVFAPMLEKFINNNSQVQTLSTLRDTLLPKLMSGETRINPF